MSGRYRAESVLFLLLLLIIIIIIIIIFFFFFFFFFPRMLWSDQRDTHGRPGHRFFLALRGRLLSEPPSMPYSEDVPAGKIGELHFCDRLAGLLCGGLAFTVCREGYGLLAWVLLMLMAGVGCFGGGGGCAPKEAEWGGASVDWRKR